MEKQANNPQKLIVDTLVEKSMMKQKVFENTFETFNLIKTVLHEMANDLNIELRNSDKRVKLEFRDRGKFEAEIRVAGDILIFSMHSNVFEFDRDHSKIGRAHV